MEIKYDARNLYSTVYLYSKGALSEMTWTKRKKYYFNLKTSELFTVDGCIEVDLSDHEVNLLKYMKIEDRIEYIKEMNGIDRPVITLEVASDS